MTTLLILADSTIILWHLIPLAAVISLVYNASRYELTERILRRAGRHFVMILLFMGIILVLLLLLSFRL